LAMRKNTSILREIVILFREISPNNFADEYCEKMSNKALSAKFRNLYLRIFADFSEIIVTKFFKLNFNFVLISYFAK
jgi:hypothetical protein